MEIPPVPIAMTVSDVPAWLFEGVVIRRPGKTPADNLRMNIGVSYPLTQLAISRSSTSGSGGLVR